MFRNKKLSCKTWFVPLIIAYLSNYEVIAIAFRGSEEYLSYQYGGPLRRTNQFSKNRNYFKQFGISTESPSIKHFVDIWSRSKRPPKVTINILGDFDRHAVNHAANKPNRRMTVETFSVSREEEVDKTLDDLLEVIGPQLFLLHLLLPVLPFALPAIPLSYLLTRYAPASIPKILERLKETTTGNPYSGMTTEGNANINP